MNPVRQLLADLGPAADELLRHEGREVKTSWLATVALFGRPAVDLARAGRWGVLGLLVYRQRLTHNALGAADCAALLDGPLPGLVGGFRFPPTRASVRVLSKVPLASVSPFALSSLRRQMNGPATARTLAHLPRINIAAIEILGSPTLYGRGIAPTLLREIALDPANDDLLDEPAGAVWPRLRAQMARVAHRVPAMRTLADARRAVEALSRFPDGPSFDEPTVDRPLPDGIANRIEMLRSEVDCAGEGQAMNHCAAQRWIEVANGWAGLYRVQADPAAGIERATLELGPIRGHGWAIRWLVGRSNRRVSLATWERVADWLRASGNVPRTPADLLCLPKAR